MTHLSQVPGDGYRLGTGQTVCRGCYQADVAQEKPRRQMAPTFIPAGYYRRQPY